MATMKLSLVLVLLLACTISLQGVLSDIICENLPTNICAFSVSSSGKRCVLENLIKDGGKVEYQCKTSEVMVGSNTAEYIETDKCVSACGVDRKSLGLSSDTLLESTFIAKLCSPACYNNCPNIVDLYFNLAAGEGVYLPDMCQKNQASHRRDMIQLQSDSDAAPSPNVEWTSPRRNMIQLQSDSDAAPSPNAEWTSPRRNMVELQSDSDAARSPNVEWTSPRRNMVELQSDSVEAPIADILAADVLTFDVVDVVEPPSADAPITEVLAADVLTVDFVDAPIADAPTQLRNARRAMLELLSSGSADAPAIDTPAPSPSYF